ncbi:meckelin-like isoform X5 [Gopherus evgoodei]|uniref:meckelin-like isoform X5 n=1 Tax=Gopherus evgoodei TaxID=1825980 RepID=UPI0011CFE129|nr:meckelin-like isoform X5 [Gopherus evgoodei]
MSSGSVWFVQLVSKLLSFLSLFQSEQFLIENYSPLLPTNPKPFEVFYWNVIDNGEMKLPQLDVDVERAASDSYNPVVRTVGLQRGGAIQILPSHCSRGCGQGEMQKLHLDLPQHCCYACEVCSRGTYSNGSEISTTPPGNCGPSQFLDTQVFQCSPCGEPRVKSPTGLRCVCADSRNVTGQAAECNACSSREPASLWEATFLDSSFLACNNSCNVTACELLTNTVILNAFSLETRAYDLYAKAKSQNLPKLFYSNTGLPPLSFGKNSKINFKLVKYDARGNFLGWEDVTGGTLQLCADCQSVLDAAYSFGTSYQQSCTVQVSNLLQRVPEPIFYEMFLQFSNEKGNWLWPVPVANPQLQLNSPASLRSERLRRFFLVDGLSGRQGNLSNQPASVTLAAGLLLSVDLPTSSPGDQSAFLLTVKYAKQDSTATTQVSFAVSYTHRPGTSPRDTDIALAILGSLAALYALLKTSSWVRRSRLQNISFIILVKFFAFFAGALANAFFVVALGTGIYWLIAFKGQQSSAVEVMVPPAGSQIETNFIIYLSCAFVLKAVDVLHLLITQVTISIFLIDWEKPKEKPAFKAPAGGQRAISSVSIWRTFLIANEWNEIQTHRKLNPSLQLFAVLLLLEVVGLKNITSRDLNVDLHPGTDAYLAAWSPILRFGIAASLWLALGIAQVAFFTGIYEQFVEDKIHQFIDLCSMSNVSVFILMHGCYGFYVHGRSVHGHADVGMDAMHACLRKEEENLCPLRGLEANSDIQTFEVLLTDRARQLYDKITQPLMEGPRGERVRVNLHEQRLRSYYTLNRFLSSFLEHAYRDMDYVVKDKFFLERFMDMEFQEPVDMSILYPDASALFSRTLFYNNELALLVFDNLLFSVVDLGTQDFLLAAIITFIVQKLVKMLRHALGRRNLAAKTLVEKQFLI